MLSEKSITTSFDPLSLLKDSRTICTPLSPRGLDDSAGERAVRSALSKVICNLWTFAIITSTTGRVAHLKEELFAEILRLS